MLYLITGSNGTGKTLNVLKWVRDLQMENPERPVFYNGRFKLKPEKESEFGWAKFDFEKWQELPDGAICLVDEAHNDLPVRASTQKPPDYIAALAEHRSRGFDFFLISQHPSNIDPFVRRLVGSPGWHRHIKRPFGYEAATVLEFDSVNLNCEKPNQAKAGTSKRIKFPREVYSWYDSAVMHTGKKTIPKQFIVLVLCLLLIPALVWGTFRALWKGEEPATVAAAVPGDLVASVSAGPPSVVKSGPVYLTKDEWLQMRVPRLLGLPHTAPRYDRITEPVRAPYPAGCVNLPSRGCQCFTQQATPLHVAEDFCLLVVRNGYFLDFEPEPRRFEGSGSSESAPAPVVADAAG